MSKLSELDRNFNKLIEDVDKKIEKLETALIGFYKTKAKYELENIDVWINILKNLLTVSASILIGLLTFQSTNPNLHQPFYFSIILTILIAILLFVILLIRHFKSKDIIYKIGQNIGSTNKRQIKDVEKNINKLKIIAKDSGNETIKKLKKMKTILKTLKNLNEIDKKYAGELSVRIDNIIKKIQN